MAHSIKKCYIGNSSDPNIQYKASSGGIGTEIIKYLLENKVYQTAVSFYFCSEECCYKPRLIYTFDDYNVCGSIYQDIDLVGFIRQNIGLIKHNIIITCLPCQVKPIRSILKRNDISCVFITFTCSGQTTIDGTYCYYKMLKIKKQDVIYMQYRGNGWPSGIQIHMKNGDIVFHENYTFPWSFIIKSELFKPKRCFLCKLDTDYTADFSLADPWLKEYLKEDKIGHSFVIVNTEQGDVILSKMKKLGLVSLQDVDYNKYIEAQVHNVSKKDRVEKLYNLIKIKRNVLNSKLYKKFFSINSVFIKIHISIWNKIFYKFSSKSI
ncbi:MAG: Coenzyme F420 hydrogenase/dehydrogenase, beta subunit C-terminal domain [Bacteroidetes bacterium]|uniref:Coenzyme F420 hydrogenase/dehydrogenase, beta subunit C-terminal domain n=1 Tax=Candidatus Cryptobacteroides excrementipullorum TaxID=2840761 RepID=A0A9D9IUG3_9BACT|nr:Coenzyme F420 hydrogenase/dehydrogenase, beta subunit C-terminal domain [Candidatus Cryptobacteroides excrementipullorum]